MSSQAKKDKLTTLGYTGSMQDAYLKWLLARGATSNNITQAEMQFLIGKGFTTGTLDDRWYNYLGSLTYTGARPDREDKFWKGTDSN